MVTKKNKTITFQSYHDPQFHTATIWSNFILVHTLFMSTQKYHAPEFTIFGLKPKLQPRDPSESEGPVACRSNHLLWRCCSKPRAFPPVRGTHSTRHAISRTMMTAWRGAAVFMAQPRQGYCTQPARTRSHHHRHLPNMHTE